MTTKLRERYVRLELELIEWYIILRRLVDSFYDIQDVRMRTANRLRQMPQQAILYVGQLKKLEDKLKGQIAGMLKQEPIYLSFFSRVMGVGPLIGGFVISQTMIRFDLISRENFERAKDLLDDPEAKEPAPFTVTQIRLSQKTEKGGYRVPQLRGIGNFVNPSNYHSWWGLGVEEETGQSPKRAEGKKLKYNPKLRMFSWRIGRSFKMQKALKSFYRRIYNGYKKRLFENPRTIKVNGKMVLSPPFSEILKDHKVCPRYQDCKDRLTKREEPACKGHWDNMSIRYADKIFLEHTWEQWSMLEGLPIRKPYAIEKLGHRTYINWEPDR